MKGMRMWMPLALLGLISGPAGAARVTHENVVPSRLAVETAPELAEIGPALRVQAHSGILYVSGVRGLAAIELDGRVRWRLALPEMTMREIDVDDEGIAFSGFDITSEEWKKSWFSGAWPKEISFGPSVVGFISKDGNLVWSDTGPAARVSPPCLTSDSIAVMMAKQLRIYRRSDGRVMSSPAVMEEKKHTAWKGAILDAASLNRPVFHQGQFIVGHLRNLVRVSQEGNELERLQLGGKLSGRDIITAGPVVFNDKIIVGVSREPGQFKYEADRLYALRIGTAMEEIWSASLKDGLSGVGDIALGEETIYTATNFRLGAFAESGAGLWKDTGGRGGAITLGRFRGIRYARDVLPVHTIGGHLMVHKGSSIYLSTSRRTGSKEWTDTVTVLQAQSGDYDRTIEVRSPVLDMASFGPHLALAMEEGLMVIALD